MESEDAAMNWERAVRGAGRRFARGVLPEVGKLLLLERLSDEQLERLIRELRREQRKRRDDDLAG